MIAVLGGLGAAVCWALATLVAARAARVIGAWSATALVIFIGLLASVPLLLLDPPTQPLAVADLAWLTVAGLGYAVGLIFY